MFRDSAPRARLRSHCSAGHTLIEMIVSIALLGMLAAMGTSMIAKAFSTTVMVNADNASTEQARYTMERLAREIREIKYSSSGGNYCITTMTATSLVFSKTSGTYDFTCATNAITVTISKSGTTLTLGYSSPSVTSTLGDQVSTFTLNYLDSTGSTTTSNSGANAVKYVVITLVRTDPTSGQSISQRTRVALRNGA